MEEKRKESSDALKQRMTSLKERIYTLLDNNGTITNTEIIKASQELDIVINAVMRKKMNEKNNY